MLLAELLAHLVSELAPIRQALEGAADWLGMPEHQEQHEEATADADIAIELLDAHEQTVGRCEW